MKSQTNCQTVIIIQIEKFCSNIKINISAKLHLNIEKQENQNIFKHVSKQIYVNVY